ncbi:hypothetical protein Nepgr_017644 [Nepenthes gracilis]|uniref:Thioredoxin domain-containing protein n=1 Tax=Nepenthes gracilis TaxID=150966 RepID=A0AAD3SQS2_NEPGR|nr:hypothetical protein Nepgr_017644 [Nepenthes gracilis]
MGPEVTSGRKGRRSKWARAAEAERDMESQEQTNKSRVIKVDSQETWDFYISQAKDQGCPIVVHFTASWCMPSVAMNSFFEELASAYQDVLFLTVDVDDVKAVASKMEVKAMPTFLILRDGAQVDKLVGANPDEIKKRVDSFVQSIRVNLAAARGHLKNLVRSFNSRAASAKNHSALCRKECASVYFSAFHLSTCSFDLQGSSLGDAANADCVEAEVEFQKWNNGGGIFHQLAFIDPTATIEVGGVVHSRATLGADVHIGSGAIVGPGVVIGKSTKIGYNVALSNCTIGESCVIHNGVSIGQDGFGFFVDEHGNISKKLQTLSARIGNHVEIGANTCIDRGSWRDTVIGDHAKIDNLVQIGHNVIIGNRCMLCGQVGIAGSVTIGDDVILGGRVAVRDHVSIISKVRLAAGSCVTKDIKEPGDYGGFPAVPIREWRRQIAAHRRNSKKVKTQ